MSRTYTLNGYVSHVEADMVNATPLSGVYYALPGLRYITITTGGGEHRFLLEGDEPKLGTAVNVTLEVLS